ncbi:MAG: glycosyltransferase family 4 protein [Actinobacteria bacterium]|nr:glycosyltransferase family 4 protein [Actinomycetota bacterium]
MPDVRIVLDATPLLGHRTGIGAYTAHLLTELPAALVRAGHEATVGVTTWTARGGRLVDLPPGVRQVGPPSPARLLRAAWTRTDHPRVETLVGPCDVFHGTNFVSPPTRHAREVVTVHDLTYELHRTTVSADALAYRELVPRALARGAQVVCPSQAVATAVQEFYGLGPDRVHATPLGVDPVWFEAQAPDAAARARLGLPAEYLLFVGSVDPRKNLGRLVRAHALARQADPATPPLVLAGPAGRDTTTPDSAAVMRTGWLDEVDLRRLVAGARALVLPSLDEGFGLPALEALACGRPVLAADIPALREVTGGLAVLADPYDEESLAHGLHQVLSAADDDAARQARRRHARPSSWARFADATVSVYSG